MAPSIVNKVWNYAHVLRDDGVSYGDYVEQITYLLFLKMAYEGSTLLHEESPIPEGYGWESFVGKDGDELEVHYRPRPRRTRTEAGDARDHLSQGADQDPGPGEAEALDLADGQRDVAGDRRGCEGRNLRGALGAQRRRREERGRAVLHTPPAHQGHSRSHAPRPRDNHLRPGLRH